MRGVVIAQALCRVAVGRQNGLPPWVAAAHQGMGRPEAEAVLRRAGLAEDKVREVMQRFR